MLITTAQRSDLYKCIPENLSIVELGVFKGVNAYRIITESSPHSFVCVDAWQSITHEDYPHLTSDEFKALCKESVSYYGGDVTNQETHDRILNIAKGKLKDISQKTGTEVSFIKKKTKNFYSNEEHQNLRFDIAYIDANHQYEGVLSDIKGMLSMMNPGGLIWLNDASINHQAFRQNMGVLQAAVTAVKLFGLIPLVITNSTYSDLVLWVPTENETNVGMRFLNNIEMINYHLFEVSGDIIGSLSQRIPFGFNERLVTSTCVERLSPVNINILKNIWDKELTSNSPSKLNKQKNKGVRESFRDFINAGKVFLISLIKKI